MEDDLPITMVRPDLSAIPQFSLPDSYSFRWFQPGDEKIWQDIQSLADKYNEITNKLFSLQFGSDPVRLRHRQCFLLDSNGVPIATATAWFDDDFEGLQYGRVHWVAVIPDKQGLGLAKPLMTQVCNRLKELGHTRAYLMTSTARPPAINLYLKFGFRPKLNESQNLEFWEKIINEIEEQDETRIGRINKTF